MKYVALLSGGKDSCYNLLHCAHNGHELVSAASLRPEQGKEELDSYLYQTVGQDAIEFVAQALEVPLYRRVITGSAVEQGSEYGSRKAGPAAGVQGDETEDLHALLETVLHHHPDVRGVSVGAILSSYQRIRVEHVCRRLGLTPLCYLWQRDQGELLTEMIDAGMEAILIKVAGIGLTVKHLGKTLAEMNPTLTKLNKLYGSHVCGEGGEYESLTLDCSLFKRRITLKEVETVIHSDNDFATVAFLRVKSAILESKSATSWDLAVPPLIDEEFRGVEQALSKVGSRSPAQRSADDGFVKEDYSVDVQGISSRRSGLWVSVANAHRDLLPEVNMSVEDEIRQTFDKLEARLQSHGLYLSQVAIITVLVSDMALFPTVNAVYSTFFGVSPPARATVAVDLPTPLRVRLECLAFDDVAASTAVARQALHVQGLSYWAPANIGPYSQAISIDQRILISGQIGLLPQSLTMPSPQSLATETALSFQHVERVKTALQSGSGGGWEGHAQFIVYWLANAGDIPSVRRACEVHGKDLSSPTLFVAVKSLPRDALVEKQVMLHTGRVLDVDDDDDEPSWKSQDPVFSQGTVSDGDSQMYWKTSTLNSTIPECALICVRNQSENPSALLHALEAVPSLALFRDRGLSIRLFYKPLHASSFDHFLESLFAPEARPAVTHIPCRHIATQNGDVWDYAVCILGS